VTAGDDTVAAMLLRSNRRALVVFRCPQRRHTLGKVYATPDGPRLCVPAFHARPNDLGDEENPKHVEHFPSGAYRLVGDSDPLSRCRCATHELSLAAARSGVDKARSTGGTVELYAAHARLPRGRLLT
jgi:hypothetical protein